MVWMWTLVSNLLALIVQMKGEIGSLKDEIAVLKGLKPRPAIKPNTKSKPEAKPKTKPSGMENGSEETDRKPGDPRSSKGEKRPRNGGGDRSVRTPDLTVHEEKTLKPHRTGKITVQGASAICGAGSGDSGACDPLSP
jgi:hypothetical protein